MHPTKFIIALFSLLLLACAKEKEPKTNGIVEVYNQQDYENKIEIVDTFCISETKRAESDIKKGKIVLNISNFESKKNFYGFIPFRKDLIKELAKFGIGTDTVYRFHTCLYRRGDDFFNEYCYDDIMKNEIIKKYNYNFIDSIKTVLEKKYVLSVPDKIFVFENSDRPFNDPDGDDVAFDFIEKQRMIFSEGFIYPVGYKRKSEKDYSYTQAYFVLMKDGTIKDLDVEANFANSKNEKYKQYFEKQVKDFVSTVKWVHPTYGGIVANSEMNFYFYHK